MTNKPLTKAALEGKLTSEMLSEHIRQLPMEGMDNLRAMALTIAVEGGVFHLFDKFGYICSTSSVDALMAMLMYQNVGTVRDLASPKSRQDIEKMKASARARAQAMRERMADGPVDRTDGGSFEVRGAFGSDDPEAQT